MPQRVVVLGSTGSIGRQALEVIDRHPGAFEVAGLVAGRHVVRLAEQVRRYRPAAVGVADRAAAAELARSLGAEAPEIRVGPDGAAQVAVGTGAQIVVAAIVGAAGLVPTLAALTAGLNVALANKESLVAAGELMVRAARESGSRLLPVDSEHSAIHQCLRAGEPSEIRRLVLTASGGPFRGRTREELERVTAAEALRHPTWHMGPKITVDSATLMNKGLEVIEAHWLFGLPGAAIDVLIHPQSTVHSMVEFRDGSIVAQLGTPDMRHPIQYALTWPERWDGSSHRLDLTAIGQLTFEAADRETFPCLGLAYEALARGGDAPAKLNAANEVAVHAFLEGRIGFQDIPRTIAAVLDRAPAGSLHELADVLEADRVGRALAHEVIAHELSRT